VEAEKSFRADMGWFRVMNLENAKQVAHCYWLQLESPCPFWEVLLTPPVTVIAPAN